MSCSVFGGSLLKYTPHPRSPSIAGLGNGGSGLEGMFACAVALLKGASGRTKIPFVELAHVAARL